MPAGDRLRRGAVRAARAAFIVNPGQVRLPVVPKAHIGAPASMRACARSLPQWRSKALLTFLGNVKGQVRVRPKPAAAAECYYFPRVCTFGYPQGGDAPPSQEERTIWRFFHLGIFFWVKSWAGATIVQSVGCLDLSRRNLSVPSSGQRPPAAPRCVCGAPSVQVVVVVLVALNGRLS